MPLSASLGDWEIALLALVALVLTGGFAVLRAALLHSVPDRVLEEAGSDADRERLRPLLGRAEQLATSASVLAISFQILFVVLVLAMVGEDFSAAPMGVSLAISVPLLVFATEVVPHMVAGERSDRLLCRVLPGFDLLQSPLALLALGLDGLRKLLMRLLRIPEPAQAVRSIVEDLRDVIVDSDRADPLREEERELIENVVEFYDVDVAEIMTPRTEMTAVEIDEGFAALVNVFAESGHARIPVYEKNLDHIVGIAYAHKILRLAAGGAPADGPLRELLEPVGFVPETKLVSELLKEFRTAKRKIAVVLDEYGGTAGVVTVSDVIAELVGDMTEEIGEPAPEPIRRRADGSIEVEGSTRVSEVNEELELSFPEEEDYETLAGFVLAQLGRFPKVGERLHWDGVQVEVTSANDRRVLELLLRLPAGHKLAEKLTNVG